LDGNNTGGRSVYRREHGAPPRSWIITGALAAVILAGGAVYTHLDDAIPVVAMGVNYIRHQGGLAEL
jgi:hypothetical protein